MVRKAVTFIAMLIAFSVKLWQGFASPAQSPEAMAGGAMNDPFAVIVSGIMAAAVVWVVLAAVFWVASKIRESK